MNVYTIVLERIGTGKQSLTIVTRQDNEEAARAYAEAAMAESPDLGGRGYPCASVRSV